MAAFTLPTGPRIENVRFTLVMNREEITSPLNNMTQISVRPGAFWRADVELPPIRDRECAEEWAAALMRGIEEPFYMPAPLTKEGPISGGSTGTPLVNGGTQTGRTLNTDGWAANYELKAGDYISFANGTFEELHKLRADVTANGSGVAALPLLFPIRRSPADNTPLRVVSPRGEFILRTPEHSIDVRWTQVSRQSFSAFEWVR